MNYAVRILLASLLGLMALAGTARAALTIEITQGVQGALPIAIVPFGWTGPAPNAPEDVSGIIAADLRRSGRFVPFPEQDMLSRPHSAAEVNFKDWRVLGQESLVVGQVIATGPDSYEIRFQLLDVFKGTQLAGYSIPVRGAALRRAAHHIADIIYEKLTGEPGAFNTRIAYVVAKKHLNPPRYELQVADSDGYNPETVVSSPQPIMSPAWSPDGTHIAYVSFEKKRAEVFVQNLAMGTRESVAAFPGINGAPAWSPDGKKLALTLSQDGNPEIYLLDLGSKALTRLTDSAAIDTEPVFSPDGREIIFTSDRGGRPQLYRMPVTGGRAQRLTFEGEYNARGRFSPDGKRLAMVQGQGGKYRIAVMELDSGTVRVVSNGALDESPSFAPNGSMLIYATEARGRGVLVVTSVDGRVQQRLALQEGDVREPAWSPINLK